MASSTALSGPTERRARMMPRARASRSRIIASLVCASPSRSIQATASGPLSRTGQVCDGSTGSMRTPSARTRTICRPSRCPTVAPLSTAAPRSMLSTPTERATRASK
ncbi:hypothetical protein [Microbacterium sp. NPDC091662]|uniref:hypothetical protein n=1 Tax=Microbacterium sp. NPDC091662 TaxID=3364211 RepID=UPI0038101C0C